MPGCLVILRPATIEDIGILAERKSVCIEAMKYKYFEKSSTLRFLEATEIHRDLFSLSSEPQPLGKSTFYSRGAALP
jgi:hypothetical protein